MRDPRARRLRAISRPLPPAQSKLNGGNLAVCIAEQLPSEPQRRAVSCAGLRAPIARTAVRICSLDGCSGAIKYGQTVALRFCDALGCSSMLGSAMPNTGTIGTQARHSQSVEWPRHLRPRGSSHPRATWQLVNKHDVFAHVADDADAPPPYQLCAWTIQPAEPDARLACQGCPVRVDAPFTIVHAFTNRRLAGLTMATSNEFGTEACVCAHTFHDKGKVRAARPCFYYYSILRPRETDTLTLVR